MPKIGVIAYNPMVAMAIRKQFTTAGCEVVEMGHFPASEASPEKTRALIQEAINKHGVKVVFIEGNVGCGGTASTHLTKEFLSGDNGSIYFGLFCGKDQNFPTAATTTELTALKNVYSTVLIKPIPSADIAAFVASIPS